MAEGYFMMKPPLGSQEDQDALWVGLNDGTIDIAETDHAPHTKEEKVPTEVGIPTGVGKKPAFGVPGLETVLGLMYKAVKDGKIKSEDVVKFLYTNPKKIFNIPDQGETYVEIDPELPYITGEDKYETKCGWSPFEGMTLYGKVQTVVLHGKKVLENGKIL